MDIQERIEREKELLNEMKLAWRMTVITIILAVLLVLSNSAWVMLMVL